MEAEGGRLVKEADFEAKKNLAFQLCSKCYSRLHIAWRVKFVFGLSIKWSTTPWNSSLERVIETGQEFQVVAKHFIE